MVTLLEISKNSFFFKKNSPNFALFVCGGQMASQVYILATRLMVMYKSVAIKGKIYLVLSRDTHQCCYNTKMNKKKKKDQFHTFSN